MGTLYPSVPRNACTMIRDTIFPFHGLTPDQYRTRGDIDLGHTRGNIWRILQETVPVLTVRRQVIIGIKGNAIARLIQPGVSGDGCACFYAVREVVDEDTVEVVAR